MGEVHVTESGAFMMTEQRARPEEIVQGLVGRGFHEYKRELARTGQHHAAGGMWLGLDEHTGAVASVIWITQEDDAQSARVFVEIDGQPFGAAA